MLGSPPPPDGLVANPAHLEYVKQIAALHFHSLAKKCQADWAKFPTLPKICFAGSFHREPAPGKTKSKAKVSVPACFC